MKNGSREYKDTLNRFFYKRIDLIYYKTQIDETVMSLGSLFSDENS